MPLPRGLARFNRVVTNRISRPLAGWLPGFAVIVHRGRKSGAEYRTPVNAWLGDDDVIVALTYGRDTDWLKNLTAADGGEVIAGRKTYRVGRPQVDRARGDEPDARPGQADPALYRCRRVRPAAPHRAGSAHLISTLPESWDAVASKAASKSSTSKRWVITGEMSTPDWIRTFILYQVSNISRP